MTKKAQARFLELLSTTSDNFLGSGLTFEQFMQLHTAKKIAASWALQDKKERKRRLHVVMELCAELTKIKEQTNFATRLAEDSIEAVIEGDWKRLQEWTEDLFLSWTNHATESEEDVYARFRELLQQAYATRPEAIEVKA